MRYTDILLEYNRDQTVKNYGEKILAVAIKDRTVPWLVIFQDQPEAGNVKVQQVLKSPEGQQTALNYLMGVIEQSDPTKNKNYAQAITRLYSMGGTLFEDISATLSQYLVKFDKLKNKKKIPAPYNDFMRYKTLNDFMSYVETLPDPDSEIEQQKVAELQVPADVKYDVVYGQFDTQLRITSDCVVLIPRNSQAGYWWAKEYPKKGVTNRWCTAWEGSNSRFDYYSKQGPLYIIIPAKRNDDNEKFQFHFETKQFMDYQDHQIGDQGMEALVSRFPSLTDVFKSQAAQYSILPLMSEEYKTAVRAHAKPASAELDQMIVKYQDKIAEFGFSSLGDYGINLQDEARQDLVPLIKDYLDQCRAALLSKTGVWKQIVTKLGTERNEDKLEVILNTDPTLKSVMENSEAGRIVADIVSGSSDISRRIDATHLQDLLLRDPLFRFVMRQIPKLYATLLNDLVPGTKVNESDDDEETTDEGFFVCIGSEDDDGFVGMLTKEDNRWREVALRGTAPHNWGGSYMSYLTPNDVMQHIRNDYSRGHDVKGPFFDEQKAMEYAYNQYGLGDEEDMSEDTIDMPFGSISGKDVDIGLQYQSEQRAYSGLKRLGLVDTSEQFLTLQEIAQLLTNSSNFHLFAFDTNPVRAYAKFIEMIGWDKNNPTKYNKQGVAEGAALPPDVIELIKKIAQSSATPEHKKAMIDALVAKHSQQGVAEGTGQFHVYHKVKGDRMGGPDYELLKSFPDKNSAVVFAKSYNEKHGYKRGGFHGAVIRTTTPAQGMAEGFNSKQEVIDHFVQQGKTAAQGAAAWERGWRGNDKKKPNPFDPNYKVKPVDNKRYGEVDETNEPDDEDDGLIAGKYTPDEFDAMVSRVGQLAKAHEKRSDPGDISKLAARLAGIEGKK